MSITPPHTQPSERTHSRTHYLAAASYPSPCLSSFSREHMYDLLGQDDKHINTHCITWIWTECVHSHVIRKEKKNMVIVYAMHSSTVSYLHACIITDRHQLYPVFLIRRAASVPWVSFHIVTALRDSHSRSLLLPSSFTFFSPFLQTYTHIPENTHTNPALAYP